jgi:deoxycytidine triphosphate deaminase
MSIKSDRWIREQATQHGMIAPFSEKQVRAGVVSYGLSSYGYDLRVSDEFKIFTNVNSAIIDPKAFDERSFVTVQADSVIVPPLRSPTRRLSRRGSMPTKVSVRFSSFSPMSRARSAMPTGKGSTRTSRVLSCQNSSGLDGELTTEPGTEAYRPGMHRSFALPRP